MLSAFKPDDSVYDAKKFYKKKSMLKLKSKENLLPKKFNLPIINNNKNTISPDKFILTNLKSQNINLNLFDNSHYNISNTYNYINNNEVIKNNSILNKDKKYLLSDNILPKLEENTKNSFNQEKYKNILNNNFKEKINKCNYLYLKYDGEENFNGIKNQIIVRINPHKIINDLKKIIKDKKYSEKIINDLNSNINSDIHNKGKNFTSNINNLSSTNKNNNMSTNLLTNESNNNNNNNNNIDFIKDYLNGDFNILSSSDNEETDYYEKYKRMNAIKIKNIFLSDIIKNVYKHMIEIRDKNNKLIGKEEIKSEFKNQINNLRNYFNAQIKIKNSENNMNAKANNSYKKMDEKKYNNKIKENKSSIYSAYNNNNFNYYCKYKDSEEKENSKYSFKKIKKNKIDNINERDNKKLLKIFKEKLNIENYLSIHNIYNNILNLSSYNNETKKEKGNELKHHKTKEKKNKVEMNLFKKKILRNINLETKDNISNVINKTQKMYNIPNFFREYKNIKQNININLDNNNQYIFEMSPKLHFVDFNEIINEIQSLNNSNNNIENLFYYIITDESLYDKVKFNNSIIQKCVKLISSKIKNKANNLLKRIKKVKINKNKDIIKEIDILKNIGNKLHKKIKIKIGTKKHKHNLTINTMNEFQEDKMYKSAKYRKIETIKIKMEEKGINLTDGKIIETETNSSEYSDVPSYISYNQIKKQKEEQALKIKELREQNKINDEEIEKIIFKEKFEKEKEKEKKNNKIPKVNKINIISDKININNIKDENIPTSTYESQQIKSISKIKEINNQKNKNKNKRQSKIINNIDMKKFHRINTHNIINKNLINFNDNNLDGLKEKTSTKHNITNNSISNNNNNSIINNKINDYKNITQNNFNLKENSNSNSKHQKNDIRINLYKKEKEKENTSKKKYAKINIQKKNISDKKSQNKNETNSKSKSLSKNKSKSKKIKNEFDKTIMSFKKDETNEINGISKAKANLFNNKIEKKKSFSELMYLINDELNVPGRNNKLKIYKYSNSLPSFNKKRNIYILNSLGDEESEDFKSDSFLEEYNKNFENKALNTQKIIQKNENFEKIKNKIMENKYKTISYFDLKEDSRLILLRPILKYTLYQNHQKDTLLNVISRLFKSNNNIKLSLNLNDSKNTIDEDNISSIDNISEVNSSEYNDNNKQIPFKKFWIKDDGAFVRRKMYKNITEKYSQQYLKKKYSKDDNDLLHFRRIRINKRFKKIDRGMGFKEFMIEELNKIDEGNFSDDFENTKKENEKIRKQIQKKREEKKRRLEEWNRRFNLFKSYIQKLKKMDDLELKHDSIRFIYKEKEEYEKKQIFNLKQAKRINEYKAFLSKQKEKRNIIDKFFMGQLVFKPNCVFTSKNVFNKE